MITSCKLSGAASTVAAYHAKEENYYYSQADGVESLSGDPGAKGHVRVHGNLAGTLGFTDGASISQADMTNLLSGRNAAGEQVGREHKVIGIDLTFSAPKSVSIAGLLTDRDPAIIAAHDKAVLETMREIERECSGTRKFIAGEITPVKTGNMAYVTVRDGFNREHEPHLHTHVVVMNMTQYGDEIKALDGRQIMRQDFNKMWGALYRGKLAANLKEAGYTISYTKKGELRLDSVSLEVEREFSTRDKQIVAAEKGGKRHMDAWRSTRKEKAPEVEKAVVLADWRQRLDKYQSKTPEQNRQEVVQAREEWMKAATYSIEAKQEISGDRRDNEAARWQAAGRRATDKTAAATADMIITEYLTELARGEKWEPITYAEAQTLLFSEVAAGRLLRTDDGRFTTWELTKAEQTCRLSDTRQIPAVLERGQAEQQISAYARTAEAGGRGISRLQSDAAVGILSSECSLIVVQGDAGAGKTTMLKAVNDIAAAQQWEVVGVAVQGVAARNLQEASGIRSTTLEGYLSAEKHAGHEQRQRRLIVVDEASMLDSRGLAELTERADRRGDRIVLVGDRNQLQAVGAGKPFERLIEKAEEDNRLLSLTENYRQKDPMLQEAVRLARNDKMAESLKLLDKNNRVTEIENPRLRRLAVAAHYDDKTLIITGSRQARDELNEIIRGGLVECGQVNRETARTYELAWRDEDGVKQSARRELAVGDKVTFLENEYKTYDVRNGDRGHVLKTDEGALTVKMDNGRTVELDTSKYGGLDYGYAMTTYKAQGQTYDKVVVEADTSVPRLQDQRNTYVQITRARDEIRIYTDDRAELREQAQLMSDKSDTLSLNKTLAQAAEKERELRAIVRGEEREPARIPELPRVYNALFVVNAERDAQGECIGRLRDIDAALRARQDLSDGEKRWTAEYLNSKEAVKTLERFKTPEEILAVGLYKSRVMDLKEAVKDLPESKQMAVTIHVKTAEIEKEREKDRERNRGRGLDRGQDFTL